jgi:heme exporter protein C
MITRLANPARFLRWSGTALPWVSVAAACVLGAGLVWALVLAPPDAVQGETVRIMYVHVPAAWLALQTYVFIAAASFVALVWRHPLAEIAAQAAAPLGAAFAFVCLATGSLWGRPMWGTWWVWDVRLTSMLILFFLYLGYIALVNAFDDPGRGGRAGSILALVGAVDLPIVKFSVERWWWKFFGGADTGSLAMPKTLHQPASIGLTGSTIDISLLLPLLVMALGFTLLFVALLLLRMRTELNERKVRALHIHGAEADRIGASVAPPPGARAATR